METETIPVPVGTRVRVWRNLNRAKQGLPAWSVGTTSNKVLAHVTEVHLEDCSPVVSSATYKRIHDIGRRKVYARVAGTLAAPLELPADSIEVHLNPWRCEGFTRPDGTEWTGARLATFGAGGHFTATAD